MSLLYQKHASRPLTLDNRVEPELYRDVFPYTHVSRIEFDDTSVSYTHLTLPTRAIV